MKGFRLILLTLAAALVLFGAIGCNTVRGVGQDMEAAGEGMQDATGR